MSAILDTCILIDVLRGNANATMFVTGLPHRPSVSAVTQAELTAGVRSKSEDAMLQSMLADFEFVPIDIEIAEQAGLLKRQYGPSHGVDIVDAMVASSAIRAALPLATLNLKHFPMFPGLERPY